MFAFQKNVQNDGDGVERSQRGFRLLYIGCRQNLKATAFQILLIYKESFTIVFYHQNRQATRVEFAVDLRDIDDIGFALESHRHDGREGRTLPKPALNVNVSPQ